MGLSDSCSAYSNETNQSKPLPFATDDNVATPTDGDSISIAHSYFQNILSLQQFTILNEYFNNYSVDGRLKFVRFENMAGLCFSD